MIQEAFILGEEALITTLNLNIASGKMAQRSLRADFLPDWWEAGMECVGDLD